MTRPVTIFSNMLKHRGGITMISGDDANLLI